MQRYYKRGWLNASEGKAMFEAIVETGEWGDQGTFDATFTITDCSRSINLDFTIYKAKDSTHMLDKVDTLINELRLFKEQMIVASKYEKPIKTEDTDQGIEALEI